MRFFIFLFLFLFVTAHVALAQASFTVNGPTEVCPNTTTYYSFDDFYPAQDFSPGPIAEYFFIWNSPAGGTSFNFGPVEGRALTLSPGAAQTWINTVGVTWNNNSSDSQIISTSISAQTLYNGYYNPYDGGGSMPGNYAYYGVSNPITPAIPFGSTAIVPTALQLSSTTLCPGTGVNLTATSSSGTINLSSTSPVQVFAWQVTYGSTTEYFFNQTNPFTYNVPSTLPPNQTVTFKVNIQFNKCPNIQSPIVTNFATVLPPAPSVTVTPTNVICTTPGQVSITATSGVSQVIVRLRNVTNGTQTQDALHSTSSIPNYTNLAAGDYQLQVENYPAGCFTTSTPFTISVQQTSLSASASPTNPLCNGGLGSITASSSNANAGLQFSIPNINGGAYQSSNVFSVQAGSYTINAQDSYGCTGSAATSLTDPSLLTISPSITSNYNGQAIRCPGQSNGEITIAGSGGTGPYAYSLNGGSYLSSSVFSGLPSGTYTTSIKDANGCTQSGSSKTLSNPPALVAGVASTSCSGASNNVVTISGASGGTAPLSYSWRDVSNNVVGTIATVSNMSPGTYSVTVSDANTCSVSAGSVVVNPPITASYTSTVASCSAVNDGSITVTNAAGGTNSFQYSLDNISYQASNAFSNQASGSHSIYIRDKNTGCVLMISNATVGLKTPVSGAITQTSGINCKGQTTAAFNAAGNNGIPPYSYSWSNGVNGASVSNVGAGTYVVTITDNLGCKGTASISVTEPPQLTAVPTASNINNYNISCKGGNDGTISLNVGGGTPVTNPPYTFSWTTASWLTPKTTQNLSGLSAGSYSVTVTDSKTCTATATVIMTEPQNAVSVSLQKKNDVTCFGDDDGAITVTGTTGVGALSYSNSTDSTTFQLSPTFSSLAPNDYVVRAKDINGCKAKTSTIPILSPTALILSPPVNRDPLCAGSLGSISVSASGGTSPLLYSDDGVKFDIFTQFALGVGSYILSVKDANGCTTSSPTQMLTDPAVLTASATSVSESYAFAGDGKISVSALGGTGALGYSIDTVTFQTGATFTNLSGGLYMITVKDANNCIQTANVFVASTPPPPSSITCASGEVLSVSVANQTDPTCGLANGSVQVAAVGGSGTLSFKWFDALAHPTGNSATMQNVVSGTYSVRVTDSNNCVVGTSVMLTPYQATQFSVTKINSSTCSYAKDGTANLQIASGQAPYTQVWTSGETTTTATKLAAGQNTITVIDANGCSVTKTFQVPSPPALTAVVETVINPICAGGSDGSIQVLATGGTGTLSYTWNGTAGSNAIQNVKAGKYNLIINDVNNCQFTKSYSITDPALFTIDLGPDVTICPKATAQIGLTLPNAIYKWSGPSGFNSTVGTVNVNAPGTYQLTLINALGCQASDDVAITIANNLLKADFLTVSEAVVGDTIIVIDISWPIPDNVSWYLGDSATVFHADNDYALISYSEPGVYTVGVKATMSGCTDEYYQHITVSNEKVNKGGRESAEASISSFVVYPNPFEGKTNVDITLSEPGSATIKVYCLSTNLMIVSHQFDGEKNYEVELDLNGREAGVYIIVLQAGSSTKSVKVIKL